MAESTLERTPVLSVRGLSKRFPDPSRRGAFTTAVDGVGFDVAAGESLAIVGESGSGKTTVARMLMGLETPTGGEITVCGRVRDHRRPGRGERRKRARELQIVFQDPYSSLDPRRRVRTIVHDSLALRGVPAASRGAVVDDLLEAVGLLARHGDLYPRQLSGGQRQRVAIARALALDPKILILDEAVAALDVSVQAQVLNLLADLREERGLAYLFISHDLAVVNQISDRAIVLRNGRIVEEGPTPRLLADPQHAYTRQLRAAVPRPGWVPQRRDQPVPAAR
ncbi:ABC transporter ATP-binding protein [Specibacter cremeus]|uniref:ABC transporter ATP-binding protein n=1 Tax=Specibacter cremeus TaxID=1629051 RepID=UPI000F78197B|nr:ATP-binding cassette domain-containing protein [Specibacter cremeus]